MSCSAICPSDSRLRRRVFRFSRREEFRDEPHHDRSTGYGGAYAGRYGNGDAPGGDGWKYRGRGLIQLTFHDNYLAYSRAISDPSIMDDPGQVARPRHAAMSACWFWKSKGLNPLADACDEDAFNQISHKINGGWNGKLDRLENWAEARAVMLA